LLQMDGAKESKPGKIYKKIPYSKLQDEES
jgi:hypothetical protein